MAEDGKLSQAEIDALLTGSPAAHELTEYDKDALGEIGNISFGSAATVLSTLLQQRVDITTPTVSLIQASQVNAEFPKPYVLVTVEYTAGVEGANSLAIELQDAKTIADLMLGGDGTNTQGDLNELHLSAVGEAMNQMMGGAATALSSMFHRHINISPPKVQVVDLGAGASDLGMTGTIVNIAFRLRVGTLIDSTIMQLSPFRFALDMVHAFVQEMTGDVQAPTGATGNPLPASAPAEVAATAQRAQPDMQAGASGVQRTATVEAAAGAQPKLTVVHKPEYADFSHDVAGAASDRNLRLLYDVSLNVTVELGRTRRAIKDILDLSPGSIVELDKLAGEPVDILVNNKRIAVGEVVVIDENFGVRVTDILTPAERIQRIET